MTQAARTGFTSLRSGGWNWDALPLRLFVKGNKRFWNPADIDFSTDAEQWAELGEEERVGAAMLCAQFIAGEESVTRDIRPFIDAMAAEGRFSDELYLTQFCFEEAKHTEVFRRWLDAVGMTEDLHPYIEDNPGYRKIFYEALPENLAALAEDPSPRAQIRASVTYNHLVEGVLALTGYYSWGQVCQMRGIFPGMQRLVKLIGDDERRHMAWGTFTCRRHVAADPELFEVVDDTMGQLLPHAVKQINYAFDAFEIDPFGLDQEELVEYALDKGKRRLGAIESAVNADVADIDADTTSEALEERFHAEDQQREHHLQAQ